MSTSTGPSRAPLRFTEPFQDFITRYDLRVTLLT